MSIDPQIPEESQTKSDYGEIKTSQHEPEVILTEPEPVKPHDMVLEEMGTLKFYQINDLVEGTIVQVTNDSLIVDIGTKTEGIIPRDEIGLVSNPDLSEFAVGDPIKAVVIREDDEGTYILSKRRADQRLVWDVVDRSVRDGSRIDAVGFRAVKGGLLVDIGTIAFLPQILVDIKRVDNMEELVGQKFEVKVVEYDREAKPHPKIVVSRRAVIEEDLTRERDKLYDQLELGKIVEGTVVKLTDYGAFVDIGGGIQGLLHISEMSLGRIKHPSEAINEGDRIKVKILKVDKKHKRVSLGRRELLPNPWEVVEEKYKPGMIVDGVVVRTTDFGAFIKLDDDFEGLAHISELVDNKISHAKEVFSPGDKVSVFIMSIDKKIKRIKLSVKRAADAQRKAEVDAFMSNQEVLASVFGEKLREAMRESDFSLIITKETPEPKTKSEPEPKPEPEPELSSDNSGSDSSATQNDEGTLL